MKQEYQVYFKGQFLACVFAENDEDATYQVAEGLSVTKIPITKINQERSKGAEVQDV